MVVSAVMRRSLKALVCVPLVVAGLTTGGLGTLAAAAPVEPSAQASASASSETAPEQPGAPAQGEGSGQSSADDQDHAGEGGTASPDEGRTDQDTPDPGSPADPASPSEPTPSPTVIPDVTPSPSPTPTPTTPPNRPGREAIHVMSFVGSDAIILESNGRFGFVDSGEDSDYPSGKDPRYPLRPGTVLYNTYEQRLWAYLKKLGVNDKNVDFYIGTHAHSDHIGTAASVISQFKPQRIYTPEYSDKWISNKARLWDNQYVYDKLIAAATRGESAWGAHLIQHLDVDAPVVPTVENPHTASPSFDFGDMHIEIMNYGESYKQPPYINDANLMSYGVKVTAHGHSGFLAGDIEKTAGTEERLAPQIGHVDFLKLGHHGLSTSNSQIFLDTLSPSYAIQTGSSYYMYGPTVNILNGLGTRWFPADELTAQGRQAVVVEFSSAGVAMKNVTTGVAYRWYSDASPHMGAYRDGHLTTQAGWRLVNGVWYLFNYSPYASEKQWLYSGGSWYYLKDSAAMATGWFQADGRWYYANASGVMQTGWFKDGSTWYYLRPSGDAAVGWAAIGGSWYYFYPSGAMATGWVNDRGTWYYLSGSGAMRSGWLWQGSTWYYLYPSGAMATGWAAIGGSWYYFYPSGAMATGWVNDRGTWYYLRASGAMVTGRAWAGGSYSNFAPSGAWLGYA